MAIMFVNLQDRKSKKPEDYRYFRRLELTGKDGRPIVVDTSQMSPSTWNELIGYTTIVYNQGFDSATCDIYFGSRFSRDRNFINMNEWVSDKTGTDNPENKWCLLRLKRGLYSCHHSTIRLMCEDFWRSSLYQYRHHFFAISQRYCVKNERYTDSYMEHVQVDYKWANALVSSRYEAGVGTIDPWIITYTTTGEVIVSCFRSMISENDQVFPTNTEDLRLRRLQDEPSTPNMFMDYMMDPDKSFDAGSGSHKSVDDFIENSPPTPDYYAERMRREGENKGDVNDDDDDEDLDDDDDDEVAIPGRNAIGIREMFGASEPVRKARAQTDFIDDEADSMPSSYESEGATPEVVHSSGSVSVVEELNEVLSGYSSNASNQAMYGSSPENRSLIFVSDDDNSQRRPLTPRDNNLDRRHSGSGSSDFNVRTPLSGGGNHVHNLSPISIADSPDYTVDSNGYYNFVDSSNSSGRPAVSKKKLKKSNKKKEKPVKETIKVRTIAGRTLSSQPLGQANNLIEEDVDPLLLQEVEKELSDMDDPEDSNPMDCVHEHLGEANSTHTKAALFPVITDHNNNRLISQSPGDNEVVITTGNFPRSNIVILDEVNEVVTPRPRTIYATRSISRQSMNIHFPQLNQTAEVVDNIVIDAPRLQPRFVDKDTLGPFTVERNVNYSVLQLNHDAGMYNNQQEGQQVVRKYRACRPNMHVNSPEKYNFTLGNMRNGRLNHIDMDIFFKRTFPDIDIEEETVTATRKLALRNTYVDNVFYGFIPSQGIVNANFMVIPYWNDDDAENEGYVAIGRRATNTIKLQNIEWRVEWKLYAGDVATVRLIVGYFDGDPQGQFYNVVEDLIENFLTEYGFNLAINSLQPEDILSKSPVYYMGNIQDLDVPDLFKTPTSVSPINYTVQVGNDQPIVLFDKKYDLNVQAINYDAEVFNTNATFRVSDSGVVSLKDSSFVCRYPSTSENIPSHGNVFVLFVGDYAGGEVQVNMFTRVHYTSI
jgi:hypothetical protein